MRILLIGLVAAAAAVGAGCDSEVVYGRQVVHHRPTRPVYVAHRSVGRSSPRYVTRADVRHVRPVRPISSRRVVKASHGPNKAHQPNVRKDVPRSRGANGRSSGQVAPQQQRRNSQQKTPRESRGRSASQARQEQPSRTRTNSARQSNDRPNGPATGNNGRADKKSQTKPERTRETPRRQDEQRTRAKRRQDGD